VSKLTISQKEVDPDPKHFKILDAEKTAPRAIIPWGGRAIIPSSEKVKLN